MLTAPLRFGLVGLGIAGGIMVPAIVAHPRATIAGAADSAPALRQRFERDFGIAAESDGLALIARADIDAVYIATPHQWHREHAVAAARHGKHVVLEKPMALTLEDCDAIIEAVDAAGVALVVGHTHSFDPPVRRIRDIAASGELGRLGMIAMWNYTDFMYRPRRPEELDTGQGGGILFNQVPHQVDIARLIAGSPVRSVRSWAQVMDPARPTEGMCTAFLEFENNAAASLVYSGHDHFDSDELHDWVASTGRRKRARHGATRSALAAAGGGAGETALRTERYGYGGTAYASEQVGLPHFGLIVASFEHGDLRVSPQGLRLYADEGQRDIALPVGTSGRAEVIDELAAAVFDGVPPLHDGRFARETLRVCLAIQRSAAERAECRLS